MKRLLLILSLAGYLHAAAPTAWEMTSYNDFLAGRFDNVSLSREGRLRLAPAMESLFASEQPAIWSVAQASDGRQAIEAVHAAASVGKPFDIVLMDVQMPVMGGHDATRELRKHFQADELPIVALTAAALVSERDDAFAAGMNDFLTKPIDPPKLHQTLLRLTRSPTA